MGPMARVVTFMSDYGTAVEFAGVVDARARVSDPQSFIGWFRDVPALAAPQHPYRLGLLLVDRSGDILVGDRPVNRAAFVLHSALHEARPDIIAAAHAHSVHAKAWSSLGRLLDPQTLFR